jgi:hypothetical protein
MQSFFDPEHAQSPIASQERNLDKIIAEIIPSRSVLKMKSLFEFRSCLAEFLAIPISSFEGRY